MGQTSERTKNPWSDHCRNPPRRQANSMETKAQQATHGPPKGQCAPGASRRPHGNAGTKRPTHPKTVLHAQLSTHGSNLKGDTAELIYGMQYFLLEEWARPASALKYHWSQSCEQISSRLKENNTETKAHQRKLGAPNARCTPRASRTPHGNAGTKRPTIPQLHFLH